MKNKKQTMILNYQVGEPAAKDDNPQRIFKIMEPSLHEVWAKRHNDNNTMIVIGDARREDIADFATHSRHIERTLNGRKYYAYLQPLEGMIREFAKSKRDIGTDLVKKKRELEMMQIRGAVVLICSMNMLCATTWSPDGCVINLGRDL